MFDNLMALANKEGASYCDIRTTEVISTNLEVKDGEMTRVVSGVDRVAGVRVLMKGFWGFRSTSDLEDDSLRNAVENAVLSARSSAGSSSGPSSLPPIDVGSGSVVLAAAVDPLDIDVGERIEIVKDLNSIIHETPEVHSVVTGYSDEWRTTRLYTSEGSELEWRVPRTVLQAQITAKEGPSISGFRLRLAGTLGFEIFKENDVQVIGPEAAASAVRVLRARKAPKGVFPLIADPELNGVFVHEAVGHACEADLVNIGDSILEGKLETRIGLDSVTIVDDPTIPGWFGSFPYDDEGVKGRRKVLIDRGILKTYLLDRETGYKMNLGTNGSSRAQDARVRPMVRMSNTFMEGGDMTEEELFEEVDHGILAKGTRGGQVDTAKGTFQFNAQEAFLIEKGEVTEPLRDVSLSGSILQILNDVGGLGKESKMGSPGFCGKGQMVQVGDGGPFVLLNHVSVGGDS